MMFIKVPGDSNFMRDWRIFIFADPRKMGDDAFDCYLAWHQEPRDSRIIWMGYSIDETNPDFRWKGKGVTFDPSEYDAAKEMLDGKGWKLLPRANALILLADTQRGKFLDVCDLGSSRMEFVRKLSKKVDEASDFDKVEVPASAEYDADSRFVDLCFLGDASVTALDMILRIL